MPEEPTQDSGKLPGDIRTLILEYLPAHHPRPVAVPERMLTESGRMTLAQEYARWQLCDNLKRRLERGSEG